MDQKNSMILIVDDDCLITDSLSLVLRSAGYKKILSCNNPMEIHSILDENTISLILLDLYMPAKNGEVLLKELADSHPEIPVVIITSNNDINTAVRCMKNGASDFLIKPVEKEKLLATIHYITKINELLNENKSLKDNMLTEELKHPEYFSEIITTNKKMISFFKYIESIACSSQPILITGETGVGKELFAQAIYKASKREGKLITVNIAGLDDAMFTDTLFGHKKGAFTNAENSRSGLIKEAENGTLFLDEIGDLSMQSQVKLLRLLQSNEYFQLGSDLPMQANVRIIVATNKNLNEAQSNGEFRKDLYYRLCTHHISIPPLRERKEDIRALVEHFVSNSALLQGRKIPGYPKELITLLSCYGFPGNIRELEAIIHDAVSINENNILSLDSFKLKLNENYMKEIPVEQSKTGTVFTIHDEYHFPSLSEVEKVMIEKALQKTGNNQSLAAVLLGITRQTLNNKLKSR